MLFFNFSTYFTKPNNQYMMSKIKFIKTYYANLIGSIFLIFLMISCSDTNENFNSIKDEIEGDMKSGTWKITKFIDSGKNETSDYNGYTFSFDSNDILIANKDSMIFTGSWNISSSNSNDDDLDDLDFNISFSSPDVLEEITEDWSIITNSSKKIELIHISGGNGGTDLLTFEKN